MREIGGGRGSWMVGRNILTPLYEIGIQQIENKPMETTC